MRSTVFTASNISVAMVLLAVLFLMIIPARAEAPIDAPVNKATDIHGAPGNTPGFGGSSANPDGAGVGVNGGQGIHNIGAAPGQGGANEPNDRPAGNMHGGLAGATGYDK